MIEQDFVECVIGLGPNLFYNSPMEACLLITNNNKPKHKKGKILFINAVDKVKQEKTMSFLEPNHIDSIFEAYKSFTDIEAFTVVKKCSDIIANKGNMSISLYVRTNELSSQKTELFEDVYKNWEDTSLDLKNAMNELFQTL
ncbi:type I restriction-modification system, M subunit [Flavobacterium sp. TAB 87]|nr:type I restriction-modification system, M subunit [Flavobacterium sp. TAB 87]